MPESALYLVVPEADLDWTVVQSFVVEANSPSDALAQAIVDRLAEEDGPNMELVDELSATPYLIFEVASGVAAHAAITPLMVIEAHTTEGDTDV